MASSKRRNQHINPARTTENTASFWHKQVVFIRTGLSHHSLSSLLLTTSVKLFPQLSWSWPLHQAVNTSPQHPRQSGLPAKNSSYINGVLGKQSVMSLWTQNLLFMYYPYWSISSSCCAPGRLSLGFMLMGIFLWGKRFLQPSPVFIHSPLAYFLQAQGFSFNKSFFFFLSSSIHFPQNIRLQVARDLSWHFWRTTPHRIWGIQFCTLHAFSQPVHFLLAFHGMIHPDLLIKHTWHCLDKHFPVDTHHSS